MSPVGALVVATLLATAGMALAVSGWLQPAPRLGATVRRLRGLDRSGRSRVLGGGPDADLPRRFADVGVDLVRRQPSLLPSDVQLRLIDRPVAQHVAQLGLAAIGGLLLPALTLGVARQLGLVSVAWFVPLGVAIAIAVLAPIVVHLAAIERASEVRSDLRYQVSAYLDVVTMLLAGNTGYEGALEQASRAGDGRLFAELRRSMRESAARGSSLTDALRRTGAELGLDELEQIAATAALSAAEGAPVARTLAAKCATLRTALATEQESEARLRTSRLTTPIVGMALIFMSLVIYPALSFS
jgi:tight adherence protein C